MVGRQLYTRDRSWSDFYNRIIDTLPNPDMILRGKGANVSIYRNLTYDSHVDSCMTSREAGLLSCEYEFETEGTSRADKKARDFISDYFNNVVKPQDIMRYILEVVYYGYGVQELTPVKDGTNIIFDKIVGLPAEWFGFHYLDNSLLFFSKDKPLEGEPVDMKSINLIQYRATYQNPYGSGKLARIFYPVGIKKAVMKFGADFAEKFGSVFLFLITQTNDETKKRQALQMLTDMVQSGVGVFETNDELKDLNVDKSGSSDLYTGLINLMNNEISKAILGQTLTTENNTATGSQAMATVHFDVRQEIIDADKSFAVDVFQNIIKRLVDMNMTVDRYPYLKYFEDEDIQLDKSTRDLNLQSMGVKFNKNHFTDEYNLSPDSFEMIQNNPAPQPQSREQTTSAKPDTGDDLDDLTDDEKKKSSEVVAFAELKNLAEREDRQLEDFTNNTQNIFDDAFKPFYTALKSAVEKSTNYDDAIRRIINANLDISNKVRTIGPCLLTADIIGRGYAVLNIDDNVVRFAEIKTPFDITKPIFDYADVDFLKMKIPMTKSKFNELSEQYKNYAFTISSYKKEDEIKKSLEHLIECKEKRIGFKEWKKDAIEKGVYKSDLTYWQNVRAAQMSGKYKQMMDNTDIAPYWQYIAVEDAHTRPAHFAVNGTVRRFDDSFWLEWFPPNGYRCRCTVRALSAAYIKNRLGLNPEDFNSDLGMPSTKSAIETLTKSQGKLSGDEEAFKTQLEFAKFKMNNYNGKDGRLTVKPDKGFDNNAGDDLFNWTMAKESFTPSGWKNLIDQKVNLKEILAGTKPVTFKPYEINPKLSKQEQISRAVDFLKTDLKGLLSKDMIIIDGKGSAINLMNLDGFVKHIIEKEGQDRLQYISLLKDIITGPDALVFNVLVANKKLRIQGFTKISKRYVKKITVDGKERFINFTTNLSKYDKDYTGWTLFLEDDPKGIVINR